MALGQRTNREVNGTAARILEHARQAFNERGLATVGMRELARELELSPGNLSYHFPTKEALITALIERMHAANSATAAPSAAVAEAPLDFPSLDRILRAIMTRDLDNRWVMRDAVGLVGSIAALQPVLLRMQRAREARVDNLFERLGKAGLLDRRQVTRGLPLLRQQFLTQVFFWLPSALIFAPGTDPAARMDLHARAAMALFRAYCTPSGRRQLERVLAARQQA